MPPPTEDWAHEVRAGDVRAFPGQSPRSRITTGSRGVAAAAFSAHRAARTSPASPGRPAPAKARLSIAWPLTIARRRKQVGIIAVDPTSPYTGGAILGDRIRMQGHAGDTGMFIRSMATRGFLGGLARALRKSRLLLDAAGKQQVLIETVGVGQDEVDIVRLADCVMVIIVPGLGDDIQNMKAGLMEIGDIFVLNKSGSRRRRSPGAANARDAFAGDAARRLASAGGSNGG